MKKFFPKSEPVPIAEARGFSSTIFAAVKKKRRRCTICMHYALRAKRSRSFDADGGKICRKDVHRSCWYRFSVTLSAILIGTVILGSCSDIEETYRPDLYDGEISSVTDETPEQPELPKPSAAYAPVASAVSRLVDTSAYINGIPEMTSSSEITDSRLTFTVENIFSQGEYYTVSVVGEKRSDNARTYVNGELYGEFRLVLAKDGAVLDSLDIEVTGDDRFLIMESVLDGLSYGCAVVSNKRDFSADDYPDIIQLDFYKTSELEIPQYGRYFAVFDGKLTELPVYENGDETEPRGTHLELRGEGRMVQHLCVYTPSGKSLMVEKYEYIFDTEQRRLNKREVDFLGWNVDN